MNSDGRPVPGATITISPGNYQVTTGSDGSFAIDLPSGTYKLQVVAPGYKPQQVDVAIDIGPPNIKRFDLRR